MGVVSELWKIHGFEVVSPGGDSSAGASAWSQLHRLLGMKGKRRRLEMEDITGRVAYVSN